MEALPGADAAPCVLDGRDVTHLPMPARAHLGLARSFQITHVLARFTALENVALAALIAGCKPAEATARAT